MSNANKVLNEVFDEVMHDVRMNVVKYYYNEVEIAIVKSLGRRVIKELVKVFYDSSEGCLNFTDDEWKMYTSNAVAHLCVEQELEPDDPAIELLMLTLIFMLVRFHDEDTEEEEDDEI